MASNANRDERALSAARAEEDNLASSEGEELRNGALGVADEGGGEEADREGGNVPSPDPSHVRAIESMGFSRIQAENGLRHGRDGTITGALEWIMNQPPMADAGVGFSGVFRGDKGDAAAIEANELSEEGAGGEADAHTDAEVGTGVGDDANNSESRARANGAKPSPAERSGLAAALNDEDTQAKKKAQVELYTPNGSSGGGASQVGAVALSANAAANAYAPETDATALVSNPSPDERARLAAAASDGAAKKKDLAGLKLTDGPVPVGAMAVSANRRRDSVEGPAPTSVPSPDTRARFVAAQDRAAEKSSLQRMKMPYASRGEAGALIVSHASSTEPSLKFTVSSDDQSAERKVIGVSTMSYHKSNDSTSGEVQTKDYASGGADWEEPPLDEPSLASRTSTPGAFPTFPTHSSAGGGTTHWLSSNDMLGQSQSSLQGLNGVALVSARLVEENNTLVEEDKPPMNEDEVVYEVAEKVSSGYCYCGKRRVDRRVIAVLLTAAIAIVVSLSITLSQQSASVTTADVHPEGTCGGGNRGNGLCRNGQCCSPYGHCGDSPEHCVLRRNETGADQENVTIGPMSTDNICGGYYADWNPTPTIENIHPNYNVVNLFAARGPEYPDRTAAPDGSLTFTPPYDAGDFRADVIAERSSDRKRSFALSVGGTDWGFEIPDRAFSERLLDSIKGIYDDVGGLDGLDWDIFKENEPSTDEMIWIGNELKSAYPGFFLSASVVPYRGRDQEFCRAAIDAGALDFCTPVFYNGQGLSTQSDILGFVEDWAGAIGEEHLVIGLAVYDQENFQSADEAKAIYHGIKSSYPNIRGVFHWNVQNDFAEDTNFARDICTVEMTPVIGPISTDKICGGYYADWNPTPSIKNIHPNYNAINLFAARGPQDSPDGSLTFTPPYDAAEFRADVMAERSSDRQRSFLLSVGGTDWGFEIPDRAFSERLLDSIKVIYDDVGGLDGLDWDIFKDNEPSTDEMIWIGNELKSAYPGFFLSASVVPYRGRDREFCRAAIDAGALDFCTPVFYNGQGLSTQNDVLGFVADWAGAIGEEHLVIGLAVYDQENFQTADEAKAIYREIKSTYPNIRGVFHWNVQNDFAQDTNFARDICTA